MQCYSSLQKLWVLETFKEQVNVKLRAQKTLLYLQQSPSIVPQPVWVCLTYGDVFLLYTLDGHHISYLDPEVVLFTLFSVLIIFSSLISIYEEEEIVLEEADSIPW